VREADGLASRLNPATPILMLSGRGGRDRLLARARARLRRLRRQRRDLTRHISDLEPRDFWGEILTEKDLALFDAEHRSLTRIGLAADGTLAPKAHLALQIGPPGWSAGAYFAPPREPLNAETLRFAGLLY